MGVVASIEFFWSNMANPAMCNHKNGQKWVEEHGGQRQTPFWSLISAANHFYRPFRYTGIQITVKMACHIFLCYLYQKFAFHLGLYRAGFLNTLCPWALLSGRKHFLHTEESKKPRH